MTTLQVVAGYPGGPTIGTNFFNSDILRNAVVHFIMVNKVPEDGLNPSPDYAFDVFSGTINRGGNIWNSNDKLIVFYSKCGC